MKRRAFVRTLATPAVLAATRWPLLPGAPDVAIPSPAQLAWLDLEIGMFVHHAPNTWQAREYDDRSIPADQLPYTADPVQWADTAVALGARYIVMVAKHVGGFCLWQTDTSSYSVRQTAWKHGAGDVMAELSAACAARGLGLGVYLSPRDDFQGAGQSGRTAVPERQDAYNRIVRQQLTELLTRYGPMREIWFDGSSVVPVGDLLSKHAAGAMIFQGPQATIRWVGNEDGFAPDPVWNALEREDADTGIATALHGDPRGDAWLPLEVDVSIRRPNWFWNPDNEKNLLTLDQLLEIYYRSVGRGSQLLLNLPPDRTGRIPEADAARAAEFGAAVRNRFGSPLASTSGRGTTVVLPLAGRGASDHVVLEEDLSQGQRVLAYRLHGMIGGGWRLIGEGTSIGHKRIHPVAAGRYEAIRVTMSQSLGEPVLRKLAAYRTDAAPPATWKQGAGIWADDDAGSWLAGEFDLDLTPKIDAAAQYRLRFVGVGSAAARPTRLTLTVGNTAAPELIRADPTRPDVVILTVTGLGQPIHLTGRVTGASAGIILLRRA